MPRRSLLSLQSSNENTLRFSHPRDASHLLAINRFLKRGVRSGICFVALGREVLMGIGTGNKKSGSLEPLFLYLAIDYSAGAIASFGQTEAQVPQSVH